MYIGSTLTKIKLSTPFVAHLEL